MCSKSYNIFYTQVLNKNTTCICNPAFETACSTGLCHLICLKYYADK